MRLGHVLVVVLELIQINPGFTRIPIRLKNVSPPKQNKNVTLPSAVPATKTSGKDKQIEAGSLDCNRTEFTSEDIMALLRKSGYRFTNNTDGSILVFVDDVIYYPEQLLP